MTKKEFLEKSFLNSTAIDNNAETSLIINRFLLMLEKWAESGNVSSQEQDNLWELFCSPDKQNVDLAFSIINFTDLKSKEIIENAFINSKNNILFEKEIDKLIETFPFFEISYANFYYYFVTLKYKKFFYCEFTHYSDMSELLSAEEDKRLKITKDGISIYWRFGDGCYSIPNIKNTVKELVGLGLDIELASFEEKKYDFYKFIKELK